MVGYYVVVCGLANSDNNYFKTSIFKDFLKFCTANHLSYFTFSSFLDGGTFVLIQKKIKSFIQYIRMSYFCALAELWL